MDPHWADLLTDRQVVGAYYTVLPPLQGIALRSVHLERVGPGLVLRFALPVFPDRPPPAWAGAGYDRFECRLEFFGVADLDWRGWAAGAVADVRLAREPRRRVRAEVAADGVDLRFTASDALRAGRPSAYRVDGTVERHSYTGAVDRHRLGDGAAEAWDRSFHGRV
ncbi:Imm50 family immunity protein [Streptomyces sp. NPDC049040]|uniref:Imm50 family immunity protein n=1 Tax=Streptomyces sp. NPDC049040 TaxID=3365593 RepID=UPI003713ABC5